MQSSRAALSAFCLCLFVATHAPAAAQTSGAVTVQKLGAINVTHAAAYVVRDQRHARTTQTEVLLADVPIEAAALHAAFDPHVTAINLDTLRDRNYVLLFVSADGVVGMNATFSKTMTQFLNDTTDGLAITWTTRSATRLEGRLQSKGPLKTMDGTTYTVDLRFAADLPPPTPGQPLAAGGGEPGKALMSFLAAAAKKNWTAIRAGSSPDALTMFDKSYNTPAENAESAADLLNTWLPSPKRTVTGGQIRGDIAILDVESEWFPGQLGLSRVQMVRRGGVWQFDRSARAGMVP